MGHVQVKQFFFLKILNFPPKNDIDNDKKIRTCNEVHSPKQEMKKT